MRTDYMKELTQLRNQLTLLTGSTTGNKHTYIEVKYFDVTDQASPEVRE